MTTRELYTCTECGEPCDLKTQEINRHRDGMQHVTCPRPSIAYEIAERFMAARKRFAPNFDQVTAVPDWDELPYGLRALTVAAMAEALDGWRVRRKEE